MNNKFQQNLKEKGNTPGGPFLMQLLFKDWVDMPSQEKMTAVLEKHCGTTEPFVYNEKMAGFSMKEYLAEFKEGNAPITLSVMGCNPLKEDIFDDFTKSQMWDCMGERDRILQECKYQVVATDMLAGGLPPLKRADLDMDFMEALSELYPTCEAFYFQNSGKMILAEDIRNHQMTGLSRFIRFAVNARFFNIEGSEDMVVDTVGMSTLFMPDLQYHFHDMDPNWVVNHAYNAASYILYNDCPIESGETIDGITNGEIDRNIQWKCQYEEALIQPARNVLDICMGEYAAGSREE